MVRNILALFFFAFSLIFFEAGWEKDVEMRRDEVQFAKVVSFNLYLPLFPFTLVR